MFLQRKLKFGLSLFICDNLPRTSLITIFKSFIRPHPDYGDTIYDRAYNTSFHQNIESIQYNAALAITGGLRGTSREKLYQELGFKSLQQRRWYRKLCCLFKIINNQPPSYLFQLVPSPNTRCFARNSFFLSTIREWNNLDRISENPKTLVFSKAIF